MFIIDAPSYQLRLGRDLSNLPGSSWCPLHAPAIHGTHGTYSNPDYVLQSGSLHCILWTGHLYSLCNNTICLHPCWVSCCFYSYRAVVTPVICSSPAVPSSLFSRSSCLPKVSGLAQIELLPWCSQFFTPFSLRLVYSPWRCTDQRLISVGAKIAQSWSLSQDHEHSLALPGSAHPDLRPRIDCVIRRREAGGATEIIWLLGKALQNTRKGQLFRRSLFSRNCLFSSSSFDCGEIQEVELNLVK